MKKWFVVAVVAVVSVLFPLVAFADEQKELECSLSLSVLSEGTLDISAWPKITTSNEMLTGSLDCNLDEFDGAITTTHVSQIKVKDPAGFPDLGDFKGKLVGTFVITRDGAPPLVGEMKARIKGTFVQNLGGFAFHQVIDEGKWNIKSDDVNGKGKFDITLFGVVGAPAGPLGLSGTGQLNGKIH